MNDIDFNAVYADAVKMADETMAVQSAPNYVLCEGCTAKEGTEVYRQINAAYAPYVESITNCGVCRSVS